LVGFIGHILSGYRQNNLVPVEMVEVWFWHKNGLRRSLSEQGRRQWPAIALQSAGTPLQNPFSDCGAYLPVKSVNALRIEIWRFLVIMHPTPDIH
jgi:hypothetical protein